MLVALVQCLTPQATSLELTERLNVHRSPVVGGGLQPAISLADYHALHATLSMQQSPCLIANQILVHRSR